jgi:pyridoxal/pyridoxine/pyridoxamine kinase
MKIINEDDAIKACDILHGEGVATVVITSVENVNEPDTLSVIASTTNGIASVCYLLTTDRRWKKEVQG